jgi:hypothetical protein
MRYTLRIEKAPWLCTTSTFPMRAFFNGGSSFMRTTLLLFWGQSLESYLSLIVAIMDKIGWRAWEIVCKKGDYGQNRLGTGGKCPQERRLRTKPAGNRGEMSARKAITDKTDWVQEESVRKNFTHKRSIDQPQHF